MAMVMSCRTRTYTLILIAPLLLPADVATSLTLPLVPAAAAAARSSAAAGRKTPVSSHKALWEKHVAAAPAGWPTPDWSTVPTFAFCGPGGDTGPVNNGQQRCHTRPHIAIKTDDRNEINATAPMLFVDTSVLTSQSGLKLRVHKPARGDRILWPTEPWENWGVFACNSVVQLSPGDANYSVDTAARMYYDCVESAVEEGPASFGSTKNHTNTTKIGWRKTCVAVSKDGVHWIKPKLGIIPYYGQPSNIIANCSAPGVFIDYAPRVPDSQRWKMFCAGLQNLGGRNGFPPPEKNELVLSIKMGCADTVPFQSKPNTPF